MSFPRYPAYKDSGVEWLGEVPEHWELSRLGFEAWVRARLGWKGLKAEEYVDDGFVFLSTPNIKGREINFDDVNFISQARYDESPEIKLSRGDVLLAKDGSTLGICNVIRSLPCPATVNSSVAVITPSPRLDSVYLHYLISGNGMQQLIQQKKGGMGVPHLFQADLVKFTVPLPTPNEQSSIATFLDRETAKIDALIAEQQRLIELLQEKRQAVISHAVTKGLNPEAPMKDSGVEWLGEVPEHWGVMRVRHLLRSLTQGSSPNCLQEPAEDGQFGVLKVGCVNQPEFSPQENKALPGDVTPDINSLVLPGDVLMSRGNTKELVGLATVVSQNTERLLASDLIFVLRLETELASPEFIALSLRSDFGRSQIEPQTVGTSASMQKINQSTIRALIVPLPPLMEQSSIVRSLQSSLRLISSHIQNCSSAIELLQERRSALISAAVTGQIDVRGLVPEASAA